MAKSPDPIGTPIRSGTGAFQTQRVVTMGLGHVLHDTYTAFLPPLLPVFTSKLSLAKTEAGLLTVFLQAPSLLQPVIGHIADRVSLRYFVILAPAVSATLMSLLGAVSSFAIMALLLLVVGLSSASLHAVGPVMTGHVSGRNLGRGMGIWMVGGELGRTLGPIIIVTAIRWLTLEGTPWLMLGGLGASSLLYLRLRDIPGGPAESPPPLPWRTALRAMAPILLPLSGIVIARAFMLSAITTYFPLFLSEEGSSLWLAGAALSIVEAAGVAGALLGGTISDHLGRRSVFLVSLGVTPMLMFAFLSAEGWLRFPLLVAMGFAALSVTPAMLAWVQESFPASRALANGVYMALSFGLRSGVVLVLGGLGDLFGLRLAFVVSAIVPLLSLPLLLALKVPRGSSRHAG